MMRKKLLIAGTLLLAAVGYLGFAGIRNGWVYYVDVDEFLAGADYHSQRVRLHGSVSADGFVANPGLLTASFVLNGAGGRVPVRYQGVIPDQFEPGRDVVVEGRLDELGVFQANVLMTKCASKYEAAETMAARE